MEMVEDVDGIIPMAGSSPSWFPAHKIIGNTDAEMVQDKFTLYKKLKKHFNVPDTYLPSDMQDALDIARYTPEKRFILKPRYGAGGDGLRIFNEQEIVDCTEELTGYVDSSGIH
jgi:predicted ATP-grasp superfamily ATP-dependent carboligase